MAGEDGRNVAGFIQRGLGGRLRPRRAARRTEASGSNALAIAAPPSGARRFLLMCLIVSAVAFGERPAHAQGRDGLLNGTVLGAGVGAGVGVAFTHAVRDSDLGFSQYARGALIFGAMGAGIGVGVDALLTRVLPDRGVPPRRVTITPTIWRNVGGVVLKWRW